MNTNTDISIIPNCYNSATEVAFPKESKDLEKCLNLLSTELNTPELLTTEQDSLIYIDHLDASNTPESKFQ